MQSNDQEASLTACVQCDFSKLQ